MDDDMSISTNKSSENIPSSSCELLKDNSDSSDKSSIAGNIQNVNSDINLESQTVEIHINDKEDSEMQVSNLEEKENNKEGSEIIVSNLEEKEDREVLVSNLKEKKSSDVPVSNLDEEESNREDSEMIGTTLDEKESNKEDSEMLDSNLDDKDNNKKDSEIHDSILDKKEINEEGESSARQVPKRRLSVIVISDTESENSSDVCLVDAYQASASEAKRLRRGYSTSESDSESSIDEDLSDSEFPNIVISEQPSILSNSCTALNQRAPRSAVAVLKSCFEEKLDDILQHWKSSEDFSSSDYTFINDPFKMGILNNFLEDTNFIHNIIDDLTTLDWSRRKMDLYEFHRSSDLVNLSWQRAIKSFYDLLQDNVMGLISEFTNTKLTHLSASCALYGPGDHLLVHDDLMNDRKIAFIYYMSPWNIPSCLENMEELNAVENGDSSNNCAIDTVDQSAPDVAQDKTNNLQLEWTSEMGGALQLLKTDEKGLPTDVVKSIYPQNNSFVFFEVGSNTFHQVSEVLTYDFPRLTINGWFHGPPEESESSSQPTEPVITPALYKDLKETPHSELTYSTLNQWITSNYLSPRTKYKIQQQIENTSEISLEDFLLNDLYDLVLAELVNSDLTWKMQGPANLKRYEVLDIDGASKNIQEMYQLFSCEHFVKLLSEFTDLKLTSYHSIEIQRWTAGSYTVIPPLDHASLTELDLILYMGLPDRKFSGGSTIYLAPEEEESIPLITIEPLNNALNIVYSDTGTTRFTKYVNKLGFNEKDFFYIVTCSYRE